MQVSEEKFGQHATTVNNVIAVLANYISEKATDKSAHKLQAAQALQELLRQMARQDEQLVPQASEAKKKEETQTGEPRLIRLAFTYISQFLTNTDLQSEGNSGDRLTRFKNRDKVGVLVPDILNQFAGLSIQGFPNKGDITAIKKDVKSCTAKVVEYCLQQSKHQFNALENFLLDYLASMFQSLLSKNKLAVNLRNDMVELVGKIGSLLLADWNNKETTETAVSGLFTWLNQCMEIDNKFFSKFRDQLIDQLIKNETIKPHLQQGLVQEVKNIVTGKEITIPLGLARLRQLQQCIEQLQTMQTVANEQAKGIISAVQTACANYQLENKSFSHKKRVAAFLVKILLDDQYSIGHQLAIIRQFLLSTPLADVKALDEYSANSHLNYGQQQKHKKVGNRLVDNVSDQIVLDEIGRLLPAIIAGLRGQGMPLACIKKEAVVKADLQLAVQELNNLIADVPFTPNAAERTCLEFIGQAFYHYMKKGTNRSVTQEKLAALDILLNYIMLFLSSCTAGNFYTILTQINSCVESSRADGTGQRSTRLERIVTEFRDRLVEVALAHSDLLFIKDKNNFTWEALYKHVCLPGSVTRHASGVIDQRVAEESAKQSNLNTSNEQASLNLRKKYLHEVLTHIFTKESAKSSAWLAPFNLQAFLVRNATTIAKALTLLLSNATTALQHPELTSYAHAFNCALLSHLEKELGENYSKQVKSNPLARLLINPELYNLDTFDKNTLPLIKTAYEKHFAILPLTDVQVRYEYANLVPFNLSIDQQFSTLFNQLVARNPFTGAYEALNTFKQTRQYSKTALFVAEDFLATVKKPKIIGKAEAAIFTYANKNEASKVSVSAEFLTQHQAWQEAYPSYLQWIKDGYPQSDQHPAFLKMVETGKALLGQTVDCNTLVTSYLEHCSYLPNMYGTLPEKADHRDVNQKFPGPPLVGTEWHMNRDNGVLVHAGPKYISDEDASSVVELLMAFVALEDDSRPTALLALGKQRSADFASYVAINGEYQHNNGNKYQISTLMQAAAKDKKNPFQYIVQEKSTDDVITKLQLAIFNIAVSDNKPLVLSSAAREQLYFIFKHYKLSIHCASGVGRTGTMNMIYQGWQLINALATTNSVQQISLLCEFSQLVAYTDLQKFAMLADVFKPFNIDLNNMDEQTFARAKLIAEQIPAFKLGIGKLLKGTALQANEMQACMHVLEQLLHARRRERYSVQEPLQLISALKEIVLYYGKAIAKMSEQELASVDNSIIISDSYTEFVPGYCVPQKALSKDVAKKLGFGFAATTQRGINPFDDAEKDARIQMRSAIPLCSHDLLKTSNGVL